MEKITNRLRCNKCGKDILVKNGITMEGVAQIQVNWGYFSKKDGEVHQFVLCEDCYDQIVSTFAIQAEVTENSELI